MTDNRYVYVGGLWTTGMTATSKLRDLPMYQETPLYIGCPYCKAEIKDDDDVGTRLETASDANVITFVVHKKCEAA